LSKNEFDELHNFLSKIKKAFSSKYQAKSLIFEHGIVAPKSRRVKHAHLHILPDSSNLGAGFLASIRSEIGANGICIKSLFDIAQSQYPAYIFTEVLGEMWLFKDNENTNNRMHLRKKIAEVMGNPEIWDWALYPHQDFIQQTLFDLKISNNL
jgi:diadenosine tetraphosphate (Ap4A) HIT family hydrolase